MNLSLFWLARLVCATCLICKQRNFKAVLSERHESVVRGVVVEESSEGEFYYFRLGRRLRARMAPPAGKRACGLEQT